AAQEPGSHEGARASGRREPPVEPARAEAVDGDVAQLRRDQHERLRIEEERGRLVLEEAAVDLVGDLEALRGIELAPPRVEEPVALGAAVAAVVAAVVDRVGVEALVEV